MNGITKPNGFLLIDKPEGITSYDVLRNLKKQGFQKLGHAGTLDPFATGLLLVLLGNATRLMEYVLMLPKTYEAELILGATSNTDDATGIITPGSSQLLTKEELEAALKHFQGPIQQIPPAYAAVKIKGRKLYDYARAGETVVAKPREVMIYKLELLDYTYPKAVMRVTCGSGTYIRALGRDIGQALGCGAYVNTLRRTEIGPWPASQASPTVIHSSEELVAHLPSLTLTDDVAQSMRQGKAASLATSFAGLEPNKPIALLDQHTHLIGIGSYDAATSLLKASKTFPLSPV